MTDRDFGPFLKKRKNWGLKRGKLLLSIFLLLLVAYSENGVLSQILTKNIDFFDFFQKYLLFSINRRFLQNVQILGVEFN